MSHWIAYLILIVPLVLMVIMGNPMRVLWAVYRPSEVMAPDDEIKTYRVNRFLQPLKEIILVAILSGLLIHQGTNAALVGFSLRHWQLNVGIGATAGLLMVGLQSLLCRWMASMGHPTKNRELLEGSISSWVFSLFIGAFAEEFWIVLCMVAMTQLGHSVLSSVVVTSLIFGCAHILLGIEAVPALAMTSVPSCLLFLWRGSILPLLLYHWIGNIGVLYRERRNNSGIGRPRSQSTRGSQCEG